jgi:hypothetical protein
MTIEINRHGFANCFQAGSQLDGLPHNSPGLRGVTVRYDHNTGRSLKSGPFGPDN